MQYAPSFFQLSPLITITSPRLKLFLSGFSSRAWSFPLSVQLFPQLVIKRYRQEMRCNYCVHFRRRGILEEMLKFEEIRWTLLRIHTIILFIEMRVWKGHARSDDQAGLALKLSAHSRMYWSWHCFRNQWQCWLYTAWLSKRSPQSQDNVVLGAQTGGSLAFPFRAPSSDCLLLTITPLKAHKLCIISRTAPCWPVGPPPACKGFHTDPAAMDWPVRLDYSQQLKLITGEISSPASPEEGWNMPGWRSALVSLSHSSPASERSAAILLLLVVVSNHPTSNIQNEAPAIVVWGGGGEKRGKRKERRKWGRKEVGRGLVVG